MIRYDSNYAFKNLVIVDATGEIVFKQQSERKSADWMANEAAALKAASESAAAKKVAADAAEMPWSRGGVAQDWKPGDMESWGRGSVEVTETDDAQKSWGRGSVEAAEEGHKDEAEKAQASNVAKKDSELEEAACFFSELPAVAQSLAKKGIGKVRKLVHGQDAVQCVDGQKQQMLASMGFDAASVARCLADADGDVDAAITLLLEDSEVSSEEITSMSKWDHMLGDLHEMGFEDDNTSRKALADANGNITEAVKQLIALERAARAAKLK